MNNPKENKVKQIITNIKTFPIAYYHLIFINFVLFVSLVCLQHSVIYLVGSFIFITLVVCFFAKIFKYEIGSFQLISENIKYIIQQLEKNFDSLLKKLNLVKLQDNFTHTLVAVLLVIYISLMINQTLEIFIIFNFAFSSLFLSAEMESFYKLPGEILPNLLQKLRYKK